MLSKIHSYRLPGYKTFDIFRIECEGLIETPLCLFQLFFTEMFHSNANPYKEMKKIILNKIISIV